MFLYEYMPKIVEHLHYRHVSTYARCINSWPSCLLLLSRIVGTKLFSVRVNYGFYCDYDTIRRIKHKGPFYFWLYSLVLT